MGPFVFGGRYVTYAWDCVVGSGLGDVLSQVIAHGRKIAR